jgi:pimeloyl-ACP methyl ester carboxylesterase
MPVANNQGVHIHFDSEGAGVPLVCMHGFSSNRTIWRSSNFVAPLGQDYRLVLIDARGHGESDKPHEPAAYDFHHMVDDIIAVLDTLHIDRTHYLGYSMGGEIGFALATRYPQRLRSLIVGGSSPYNRETAADVDFLLDLYGKGVAHGIEALIAGFAEWGEVTPAHEARLRSADLHAQLAWLHWYRTHIPFYGNALAAMTMPCLLYAGELDEPYYSDSKAGAAQLPNATFVGLPGMKHGEAGGASELLVPHIREFLAAIA